METDFLQSVWTIIDDNIDEPLLSVEYLASNLAVSKSTLNRKLSTLSGLSANKIIKQQKLRKARTLLMSGKNVSETAYLAGFGTSSYFVQCFKEFYKETPKTYSKNHS